MTNLEQAARAEAARRWPHSGLGEARFTAGASWLAEYLLSNENVAPIARALYVAQMAGADEEPDWENETGYVYDGFMADARAALRAVLSEGELQ